MSTGQFWINFLIAAIGGYMGSRLMQTYFDNNINPFKERLKVEMKFTGGSKDPICKLPQWITNLRLWFIFIGFKFCSLNEKLRRIEKARKVAKDYLNKFKKQ